MITMPVYYKIIYFVIYSIAIVAIQSNTTNSQVNTDTVHFQRPMTLVTQDHIDIVKYRVANGIEPQSEGYSRLLSDANSAQSFTPNVPSSIYIDNTGGDNDISYWNPIIQAQVKPAVSSALAYVYSDNTDYADKAVEILNAWANASPTIDSVQPIHRDILIGRHFTQLIHTADLIWDYSGWQESDRNNLISYLKYVDGRSPGTWRTNNIGDQALLYKIALACLLQDSDAVNYVEGRVSNWLDNATSDNKITHNSTYNVDHLKRETDRGISGLGYSFMSGSAMAIVVEMLRLALDWDVMPIVVANSGGATMQGAFWWTTKWKMDWISGAHTYPFYDPPEEVHGSGEIELFEYLNNYLGGQNSTLQNFLTGDRFHSRWQWLYYDYYVTLNRGDISVSDIGHNIPDAPNLLSPENNNSDISKPAIFLWEDSDKADVYELQISLSPEFSSIFYANNEIENRSYEVDNLLYNTKYFWRVRARNSYSVSQWSEIRSFTTDSAFLKSEQTIIINEGWNYISSYIAPSEEDITKLLSEIKNNLLLMSNNDGEVFWPVYNINEIDTWDPMEGYMVYMNRTDTLIIYGEQIIPEQAPLSLSIGWNTKAYLPDQPLPIEFALEDISSSLEIVTNNDGEMYWPAYEINTIGNMMPGEGYKIYVRDSSTLTYPSVSPPHLKITGTQSASIQKQTGGVPNKYVMSSGNTGSKAFLLIKSEDFHDGDEVGVWNSNDLLIGSGVVVNNKVALSIWGKNKVDLTSKFGAMNDEELRLTLWLSKKNQEIPITLHSISCLMRGDLDSTALRYKENSVLFADAQTFSEMPKNYTLHQNYPNPFNPSTTIRYEIPGDEFVKLVVYNILGQKVSILVNEKQQAGQYEVIFDADNLTSGIYFYRLTVGNYTDIKRMILLK